MERQTYFKVLTRDEKDVNQESQRRFLTKIITVGKTEPEIM